MKSTLNLSGPQVQYFNLCLLSFLLKEPHFSELYINGMKLNTFFPLAHLEKFISSSRLPVI